MMIYDDPKMPETPWRRIRFATNDVVERALRSDPSKNYSYTAVQSAYINSSTGVGPSPIAADRVGGLVAFGYFPISTQHESHSLSMTFLDILLSGCVVQHKRGRIGNTLKSICFVTI